MGPAVRGCGVSVIIGFFAACEAPAGACDADYLACDDGAGTFRLDPTCTLTGPLTVQLGQGDSHYSPLPEGVFPTLYRGPQGGTHAFVALRVEAPEADGITALEAHFELRSLDPAGVCSPPTAYRSPVDVPGHGPVCSSVGQDRRVVLGVRSPLRRDGSAIEEFGLVLVGAYQPDAWWLGVTVRDQCGRTGSDAVWAIPAAR